MSKPTSTGKTAKTLTGFKMEIDPRPGEVFEHLKNADYSGIEERLMAGFNIPEQTITFVYPLTKEQKVDLMSFMYGAKSAATNYIVVLRGDDSQSQRHGGIRQYRSFVAYVNGQEVERWRDDEARSGYYSDDGLDVIIDRWVEKWEKALGCKAIRGEITNRVRLIPERKR